MTLTLLLALWMTWCSCHSLLITPAVQTWFKQQMGSRFRFFRICYNVFALASLIPILLLSRSVETPMVFAWGGAGLLFFLLLWVLVTALFISGARAYDMAWFLGTAQLTSQPADQQAPLVFSTRGILGKVRHPWYLAALILIWVRGTEIHLSHVLENLVLTVYIFLGTWLEGRKMIQAYGRSYEAYQAEVSALIPVKWLWAILTGKENAAKR